MSYDADDADHENDFGELVKLRTLLEDSFPRVHEELERTIVNDYSLVFKWTGTEEEEEEEGGKGGKGGGGEERQKPYMVYAHLDVVPVDPHDECKWKVDPWAGEVRESYEARYIQLPLV